MWLSHLILIAYILKCYKRARRKSNLNHGGFCRREILMIVPAIFSIPWRNASVKYYWAENVLPDMEDHGALNISVLSVRYILWGFACMQFRFLRRKNMRFGGGCFIGWSKVTVALHLNTTLQKTNTLHSPASLIQIPQLTVMQMYENILTQPRWVTAYHRRADFHWALSIPSNKITKNTNRKKTVYFHHSVIRVDWREGTRQTDCRDRNVLSFLTKAYKMPFR